MAKDRYDAIVVGARCAGSVRDAELCATALELDETFSGARSFDAAMSAYQSTRDAHVLLMYEFTALQPRRPSWRSCWGPCTATRPRWTASPASMPG